MNSPAVFANLSVDDVVDLPASAGRPRQVTLVYGARYELRVSAPVALRAGAGAAVDVRRDITVDENNPLYFTADVVSVSLIAASTSDAVAWFRRCPD